MKDVYGLAQIITKGSDLNPIEALYMSDLILGNPISWTYAPSNVKHSLYRMMDRDLIGLCEETFEGDTQVYMFVCMTTTGFEFLKEKFDV